MAPAAASSAPGHWDTDPFRRALRIAPENAAQPGVPYIIDAPQKGLFTPFRKGSRLARPMLTQVRGHATETVQIWHDAWPAVWERRTSGEGVKQAERWKEDGEESRQSRAITQMLPSPSSSLVLMQDLPLPGRK